MFKKVFSFSEGWGAGIAIERRRETARRDRYTPFPLSPFALLLPYPFPFPLRSRAPLPLYSFPLSAVSSLLFRRLYAFLFLLLRPLTLSFFRSFLFRAPLPFPLPLLFSCYTSFPRSVSFLLLHFPLSLSYSSNYFLLLFCFFLSFVQLVRF